MGENPRKRWVLWDGVRLCSRLFVGLETANGPRWARKGTAKDRRHPRKDLILGACVRSGNVDADYARPNVRLSKCQGQT
jgi:hypothetical protein